MPPLSPTRPRHRRPAGRIRLARVRRWAFDVLTVQPDPEPVTFDVWPLLFDGRADRNPRPYGQAPWSKEGQIK